MALPSTTPAPTLSIVTPDMTPRYATSFIYVIPGHEQDSACPDAEAPERWVKVTKAAWLMDLLIYNFIVTTNLLMYFNETEIGPAYARWWAHKTVTHY